MQTVSEERTADVRPKKERLVAIDLLRVISALLIFVFHSQMHIGCDYGVLTTFITLCPIFMTLFFMLSGFSLYYTNHAVNDFSTAKQITTFYKKRAGSILPAYWFIAIVYPVFDILVSGGSLKDTLLLLPIDALGVQSAYHSVFWYGHNSGTWFISCLLFSYAAFPLLFKLMAAQSLRQRTVTGLLVLLLSCYAPIIAQVLNVEWLYTNVFYRMLEFVLGMALCAVWQEIRQREWYRKWIANWFMLWAPLLFLVPAITVGAKVSTRLFGLETNYQVYNAFTLPCFCLMLLSAAGLRSERLGASRLLNYSVKASYVFYYAQFFTWATFRAVLPLVGIDGNWVRIFGSFAICVVYTLLLHEGIEKPLGRAWRKRL